MIGIEPQLDFLFIDSFQGIKIYQLNKGEFYYIIKSKDIYIFRKVKSEEIVSKLEQKLQ